MPACYAVLLSHSFKDARITPTDSKFLTSSQQVQNTGTVEGDSKNLKVFVNVSRPILFAIEAGQSNYRL